MALSDPQVAALTQALQQAVQILQSGAGAGDSAAPEGADLAADPADPNAMMDDGDADDLDPAMGDDADPMADPNADPAMGGMPQPGLHDRVEQLENHTGLNKSASAGLSIELRLDQLEKIHLESPFDGELIERIEQLEAIPKLSKALAKAAEAVEAPESIDLAAVIKATVEQTTMAVMAKLQKSAVGQDELPGLGQLRTVATRRSQQPLEKSAEDEDDLEQLLQKSGSPLTSSLMLIREMARGGDARMMFSSVADDDETEGDD